MKNILYSLIPILFQGCFLATYDGIINEKPKIVQEAIIKVTKNINYDFDEGLFNAWVKATINTGYGIIEVKSKHIPNANLLLYTPGSNPLNNTGTHGAIRLTDKNGSTQYQAAFATESGDPYANGRLIFEFAKQQILMDKGKLMPVNNIIKRKSDFIIKNIICPTWAAQYVMKQNPLISNKMRNYVNIQSSVGDFAMLSLIAASFISDNDNLIPAGLACGVIWRCINLLLITDVNDYNDIARTGYNFDFLQ